jgi:hypothetical protein
MGKDVVDLANKWLGTGVKQISLDDAVAGNRGRSANTDDLPTIELSNRQLRDITDDALDALLVANGDDPNTFVRSGYLVRVVTDEAGRHTIQGHSMHTMRGHLSRVADWQETLKEDKDGDRPVTSCAPRLDVVQDVLHQPEYVAVGIPPLTGVVSAPVLGPDKSIHTYAHVCPPPRLSASHLARALRPGVSAVRHRPRSPAGNPCCRADPGPRFYILCLTPSANHYV